jgi:prepilin-type N-terminal cleavage/methylation domain-containing protein
VPTNATSSRESGFTLLELSIALAIVAILTIIALPMFMGVRGQAEETAAQTELRDALVPLKAHILDGDRELSLEDGVHEFSGTIRFDGGAVAGIKLQQASDGAICMWRIADTGLVFGLWTSPSGGATLYTELASLPEDCPQSSNASEAGFSSSW